MTKRNLLTDPKFAEAAAHFEEACKFSRRHNEYAAIQLRVFGDHGALISGCVRDHFPDDRKNVLRDLARKVSEHSDKAWKARPPRVRTETMRKLSHAVVVRDGGGFYGPR